MGKQNAGGWYVASDVLRSGHGMWPDSSASVVGKETETAAVASGFPPGVR
jgi:hypothetical protein